MALLVPVQGQVSLSRVQHDAWHGLSSHPRDAGDPHGRAEPPPSGLCRSGPAESLVQKSAPSTRTVLLVPSSPLASPREFPFFLSRMEQKWMEVRPGAPMAEKGTGRKMKAFLAPPAAEGPSHGRAEARSHPHHDQNCGHPHILGAITFLPREAPRRVGGHVST